MLQLSQTSGSRSAVSFPRRRRPVRGATLALLLGLVAFSPGHAADAESKTVLGATVVNASVLKRMTVEELLAQNVVSVSRKPEAWSEAASNVFLIRGQTSPAIGATSLPELLRVATNLFVAQSSSSNWAVNARGFVRSNAYSNKLLVMIDGRTVYSPLFSNVFWDSTSVFLPDLDTIEVISGPAGSTWGANAVNGVINLQTKSARETLGNFITIGAGSEARTFGVRSGLALGSTGALRVYAQGAQFASTRDARGRDDDADSWKSLQAGFRADWGAPATGALTVQGDAFRGHFTATPLPEGLSDNANLLVRWQRDLSPDSHLWVRAYHDYSMRDNRFSIDEISRSSDLEFQHRFAFGDTQEILWGADYRLMSDSVQHTLGYVILPPKLDFALGSVFAQHETGLFHPTLRLTTGLRLEHNHFSGWEYQPSVRLAWRRPRQTAWLAVSRATRIPSRLDTGFYFPTTPPYIAAGGPDFKSEVLTAYEIGWRTQPTKDLSLTSTLFFHDYGRLRTTQLSTPVVIANGAEGRSYGLEVFADWDIRPWWRLRVGGFTVAQDTKLKPGRTDTERGIGESSFPDYQLQLRNTFRFGDAVTLWTGLRRIADVPGFENGAFSLVPAYTELDANLTWRVTGSVELSLGGHNLLHPYHPEIGANATRRQIPRTLQGALRWSF